MKTLIAPEVMERLKTTDDFLSLAQMDSVEKNRFDYFRSWLGKEFPDFSEEDLLKMYIYHHLIRPILEWEGHHRLMALLEFELKNKQNDE